MQETKKRSEQRKDAISYVTSDLAELYGKFVACEDLLFAKVSAKPKWKYLLAPNVLKTYHKYLYFTIANIRRTIFY